MWTTYPQYITTDRDDIHDAIRVDFIANINVGGYADPPLHTDFTVDLIAASTGVDTPIRPDALIR